jgi:hypothetical protein
VSVGDDPRTATEYSAARELVESEDDGDRLVDRLRDDANAEAILRELAGSSSVDDRMWVVWVAPRALNHRAVPILRELVNDRDPDVRTEAMSGLAEVEPSLGQELWPQLRRGLRSKDPFEPISAMWTIARLDLHTAAPEIRDVSQQWPERDWRRKISFIVLDHLEGRDASILQRIRDHDHEAMGWLTNAASMMHSREAAATLAWAAAAFENDPECLAAVRKASRQR